jgi:hypothetical protein
LNETRFGPKKKSSPTYLGPKNLDTFQVIRQYVQPCLLKNPKYTFYTIKSSLKVAYKYTFYTIKSSLKVAYKYTFYTIKSSLKVAYKYVLCFVLICDLKRTLYGIKCVLICDLKRTLYGIKCVLICDLKRTEISPMQIKTIVTYLEGIIRIYVCICMSE